MKWITRLLPLAAYAAASCTTVAPNIRPDARRHTPIAAPASSPAPRPQPTESAALISEPRPAAPNIRPDARRHTPIAAPASSLAPRPQPTESAAPVPEPLPAAPSTRPDARRHTPIAAQGSGPTERPQPRVSASPVPEPRPRAATWARYRVVSTPEGGALPVRRVTVARLPAPGAWALQLLIDDTRTLRAWLFSDRVPMEGGAADPGTIRRYIVQEGNETPLEYVDAETGLALLPPFQFTQRLLPSPAPRAAIECGFAATGYFLGHVLSLEETGAESDPALALPTLTERLELDPGLLIGTSRNFRDTASGRVAPPSDYPYRPLTREEYEEMRTAGANEFIVEDAQVDMVRRRGFYHKGVSPKDPYPEILYRSTYIGAWMFMDEPAVRMGGDGKALDGARRPKDLARLLETRTRTYYTTAEHGLAFARDLRGRGVNLGFYQPFERDIPVWETEYASAWYQLAAGPSGLVHEGRYQLAAYQNDLAKLFGPGLRLSAEEMLELHVAFLRGAARSFGADWGLSIYGQCDPALSPQALMTAYDRGARFLWFWTSDHDHHMPYREQIDLMSRLTAHAKAHPRRPRAELRRAAEVAVAFPDGYTMGVNAMWGSPYLQLGDRNAAGVTYRDVIAAAMWEGVSLAKRGVAFDFIIDDDDTARHGYRRVIRVGEDAKVAQAAPAAPSPAAGGGGLPIALGPPEDAPVHAPEGLPEARARFVPAGRMRVDGRADEWTDADWIVLDRAEQWATGEGGTWNGPADLSARIAFAYDREALYVCARVRDDQPGRVRSGVDVWRGDSIQFDLDPLLERTAGGYGFYDVELGFSLPAPVAGGAARAAELYCWRAPATARTDPASIGTAVCGREGDEVVAEVSVPLPWLAALSPATDGVCGMSLIVNDCEGENRKGFLQWTPGIGIQKDPSQFGLLRFDPPPAGDRALASGRWEAARVVSPIGAPFEATLTTSAAGDQEAAVRVRVRERDGARVLAEGATAVALRPGRRRYPLRIDTAGLPHDRLQIEFEAACGPHVIARQSLPAALYPPAAWEKGN